MSTNKSQVAAAMKLVKSRIKAEKGEGEEKKDFDILKAAQLMAESRKE